MSPPIYAIEEKKPEKKFLSSLSTKFYFFTLERSYTTLEDLYQSLNDRHVDGALIDSYTVGSRKELFSDGVLRMSKMISYPSAYGVVMAGYARKLQKCFREFLKEERASVFQIITNNVQGVTVI